MIETKIIKALLAYGLSQNKTKVYVAALKVGTGTVKEIAEQAKLARPTVHEIIKQLIEIGLINVNSRGKRNLYIARHPEKLENILQSYERHLTGALPEFLSLFNEGGHRPKIHFYQGPKSAKEVWEDTLKLKNKILKVISIADVKKVFSKDYFDHYVPRRENG
ncbi:MAG: helix-turn-helix domain-containing protein [Candidatus Komeilibacteria bacterium]|nr:helix-turn-helix domain-containing protein [Candidatus Komeilibacteria bacterium]